MFDELTTEELSHLRVILVRFMADREAHKKYHAWRVECQSCGAKLTACTSVNRSGTKMEAEHIYLFSKDDRPHWEQ